jgi:hypothetical protein
MISEFETVEVLVNLMAAYPSFQTKSDLGSMVQAYRRALSDQAPAAVRRAVAEIVTGSKFFPSAHELRTAAVAVWTNAAALLTKDPEPAAKWSQQELAEFERLTGRMPRRVGDEGNRKVFEGYARYVAAHRFEDVEVCDVG